MEVSSGISWRLINQPTGAFQTLRVKLGLRMKNKYKVVASLLLVAMPGAPSSVLALTTSTKLQQVVYKFL